MYTLIAFATQWGSKHGGINSFNADFLANFGAAYHHSAQIICVVTSDEAADEAAKSHVQLIALPYVPENGSFDVSVGELSIDLLRNAGITFEPAKTIWLGHDLITGEAAIVAAKLAGGRSAVIHHMSYDDYESYAKDTESARKKTEKQTAILKQSDLILAIGPLLRDAASDRVGASKDVHMLVPGLAEIETKEAPKRFVAFVSGRLSADAARIKQGHLGVAAFAAAELKARNEGVPEPLIRQPKLLLRGVDFENRASEDVDNAQDRETELQQFADEYAKAVVNLHALPYTEDRQQLYSELSASSVALMPSWHEGFGLVAWEAIAAGVPLIVGENTGVYRLLDDEFSGAQTGYIYPVYVGAKRESPYFQPEDLEKTINALRSVALDPAKARTRAGRLRNELLEKYTWPNCCEDAATAFSFDLQKGSVPDRTAEIVQGITQHAAGATSTVSGEVGPLKIPRGHWRPGVGMADSQLLRAEEELLPFDTRRQPDVDKLTAWAADTSLPITVRLITGEGGQGKTRLAIQVCQQLRHQGWHSGFLDSSLDANRISLLWRDLGKLNQQTFIVIDYAETRQEAFLSLLRAALQYPPYKSVRLLLLARNGGEWWDLLQSTNSDCEALLNGPATTGPFALMPLYEQPQDRQQAFSSALSAFAETLQVKTPQIVPELTGNQFARPLFVQMAALLALYGERPATSQGLTKALLNHERRYWIGLLGSTDLPDPARSAEQLLAIATLAGGFPTSKVAESFWTAANDNLLTTAKFNSLFRNLAALYPGAEGLQALRPDLLGEALVAQSILRPDGDVIVDALLGSSATQSIRRNALTVLARMSNERTDVHQMLVTVLSRRLENCAAELIAVSTETRSRLPELAELAFADLTSTLKNKVAGSLKQSLPYRSVQLAQLSCSVFAHLTERGRHRIAQSPHNADRLYEYSEILDRYATALFDTGQNARACEMSHETVLSMSKLMSPRDRKRFEPTYARYLFNYANHLANIGNDEDALSYDFKGLEIRERLFKQDPNKFEAAYARSLDHYGVRLASMGRYKEALYNAEQAVAIYEKLSQTNPVSAEPDYAGILTNYALRLSRVGNDEKALDLTKKALEIRDRWKQKNPDRYEPDYAAVLRNYAGCLCDVGRLGEARDTCQNANVIWQQLAEKHPQRFNTELFINSCFLQFLDWMTGAQPSENSDLLHTLPSAIPPHEQVLTQVTAAFVGACVTEYHESRVSQFRSILSDWDSLSLRQQKRVEQYRFCAAAWCARFDSLETKWQHEWQEYLTQRNGKISVTMTEVARRLKFEFPTFTRPAD